MTIEFVRLTRDDLPLLARWFEQPHVRRWWFDANSDPGHLEAKYGPRIDGAWPEVFVVRLYAKPVGFIQWCPLEDYTDWYGQLEEAKDAIGIDYLIGEHELVGRGIGTRVIGEFVKRLWERFPKAGGVIADPQPGNSASCRVLEKNGFRAVFEGRLGSDPVDSRVYRLDRPREEQLSGGNVSSAVVRLGDTVRRPTGSWTPTIHSFLHHLEQVGFDGAPKAFGIDEDGREILEFVPGIVPWRDVHHRYLGTDEAMWRAGQLLRDFHYASASFRPSIDAVWREPERQRDAMPFVDDRGVIVCHNDPTAWNLVVGDRWAFIDWDFAGPRPFIWDVAYALIGFLPVARDASSLGWDEPVPFEGRLRAFVDGYQLLARDGARLIEVLVARISSSYEHLRTSASIGAEPWATLWHEGHGEGWADILAFTKERRTEWERAVTRTGAK